MIENKSAQSDSKQCAIKIELVKKCPKELSFTIGLMSHNLYISCMTSDPIVNFDFFALFGRFYEKSNMCLLSHNLYISCVTSDPIGNIQFLGHFWGFDVFAYFVHSVYVLNFPVFVETNHTLVKMRIVFSGFGRSS